MLTDPSKGGSSLAQAFMQSGAPQQAAPLPTITQPQARPLPQIAQPRPQRQQTASASTASSGKPNFMHVFGLDSSMFGDDTPSTPVSVHNAPGQWIRQKTPSGWDWAQAQQRPVMGSMAPAQSKFPSQAQLLAQAINKRAQGGG